MKKLFLTTISFVLLMFSSVAQNASTVIFQNNRKNIVKITPVTIIKSQLIMLHYERVISKHLTFSVGIAPIIWPPLFYSFDSDKFNTGIAIDPEIRWYVESDKIMNGSFFGFYNSNRSSSWESHVDFSDLPWESSTGFEGGEPVYVTNRKTIIGIQLGKVRQIGDHFIIEFYYGLGVYTDNTVAKVVSNAKIYDERNTEGLNLRFNLALGWRF